MSFVDDAEIDKKLKSYNFVINFISIAEPSNIVHVEVIFKKTNITKSYFLDLPLEYFGETPYDFPDSLVERGKKGNDRELLDKICDIVILEKL